MATRPVTSEDLVGAPDTRALESLGGSRVFRGTMGGIEERVRRGFPFRALTELADAYDFNVRALADVLDISERSLARRKAAARLTPVESDRLYRIARIAAVAEDIIGARDKASRWLKKPNRALGGLVPFEQLDTEIGARRVEAVLLRAAHGVVS